MKRSNDQPLKDAISEMLDTFHLRERVNEVRLRENWEKIFGRTIAKYTRNLSVRGGKLYLTLDSASLRQELTFNKAKMIGRINAAIGPGFVEEIIFR